jgi:hypothetical protein
VDIVASDPFVVNACGTWYRRPADAEDEYPYLTEMAVEHVTQPGYDYGDEFAYDLEREHTSTP